MDRFCSFLKDHALIEKVACQGYLHCEGMLFKNMEYSLMHPSYITFVIIALCLKLGIRQEFSVCKA